MREIKILGSVAVILTLVLLVTPINAEVGTQPKYGLQTETAWYMGWDRP